VRIGADALDLSLPASGAGLVQQIRPGEQPNTVVLTLDPTAGSAEAMVTTGPTGTRLIIDVPASAVSAAPPEPVVAPPPDLEPSGAEVDRHALLAPRPVLQTVVLDPGHGGTDSGVQGTSGGVEKTIALAVAQRLRELLETGLGVRVILTRDNDIDVGLDRRAAVANNAKADLFLSLHANASPSPGVAGAEVYYLELDREGEQVRQEAAAAAVTIPVVGGGTRRIEMLRWDLAQARHVDQSATLAAIMADTLAAHVTMGPSPIRRAPLRVLEGVNMPAVLVEMAYLTNPAQEALAQSEDYVDDVAQALFDAVVRFRRHLEEAPRP
jgi:N-acetylmuramoyl-L-alanine amidase